MPMDLSLYPPNWANIAFSTKESADWRCEDCGRDCLRVGENILGFAKRILHTQQPDVGFVSMRNIGLVFEKQKRWELQACHIDQNPANNEKSNLKALCCCCHRKLDNGRSQRAIRSHLSAERSGQLSLL